MDLRNFQCGFLTNAGFGKFRIDRSKSKWRACTLGTLWILLEPLYRAIFKQRNAVEHLGINALATMSQKSVRAYY